MDIRILQYFLAAAREESITKAAEVLHMTQPPLSRQLKELEEELGKQLFIRGSKKLSLTEDGILLRKRAEEIIDLFEKTRAELTCPEKNISGKIFIGSGETDVVCFLALTAKKLQEQYPDIKYQIYSGDAGHIIEKLDKGLIDFGLLVEPVNVEKYDYIKLPKKDAWGVLMRKDDPLAEKENISAEDIIDKPLIISHQTHENTEIKEWFKKDISSLNIAATYDLIYNASHFVKNGLGYALVLDKLLNTTGESPLCFKPLYPPLEAGLCIVWKKNQIFSRASKAFLSALQDEINLNNSNIK